MPGRRAARRSRLRSAQVPHRRTAREARSRPGASAEVRALRRPRIPRTTGHFRGCSAPSSLPPTPRRG
ncbi:hypothetical protein ACFPRL_07960 [Pseudoclavibacter helvolus]